MATRPERLSIHPAADIDERDTRVPSSDQRGEGIKIEFRIASFIGREAQIIFDEHRFGSCRTLGDVWRLCFAKGLEHVMSMRVKDGYLSRLQAAQRLLEEEDATQFFAHHIAAMKGVVEGLCGQGERARARRCVQKQLALLLDARGGPYELERAGEIVERLHAEFAQLLAEEEGAN